MMKWSAGHFVFKFFLMPVLIVFLVQNKRHLLQKNWRPVLAGLVTAWAGDVMLSLSVTRPVFFIIGLVFFLCTHLSYIVYFTRYERNTFLVLKKKPLVFVSILLYAVLILVIVGSHAGPLLVPVIVYTMVICAMMLQSLAASPNMQAGAGKFFIAGAVIFIISDSLLAVNKFYRPFEWADFLVMLTYGIAQLLIVTGTTRNNDKKASFSVVNS